MSDPRCTIVIPSHDRPAALARLLATLETQTVSAVDFDVVVVLDGPSDDSVRLLRSWGDAGRLPDLTWHQQRQSGQAVARNTGASLARAPVLLFLDDDVVPEPELVSAHLRHHRRSEPVVVLGDAPLARPDASSLYLTGAWAWWEDFLHRRALPGRQPGMRDFCAGNVSLRHADFVRVGGFDSAFRGYGGEDYELGYRLLRAGVRFVTEPRAVAQHHHRSGVADVLRATRQEAHGDVLIGRKHPELRAGLRLVQPLDDRAHAGAHVAMRAPVLADLLAALLQLSLPPLERLRLRWCWLRVFNALRASAYWRGVRDALGSWAGLMAYRAEALPPPHHTLDVSAGLPVALPSLWVEGPSDLAITARGAVLGTLRLRHVIDEPLHALLARQLIVELRPRLDALVHSAEGSPEPTTASPSVPR